MADGILLVPEPEPSSSSWAGVSVVIMGFKSFFLFFAAVPLADTAPAPPVAVDTAAFALLIAACLRAAPFIVGEGRGGEGKGGRARESEGGRAWARGNGGEGSRVSRVVRLWYMKVKAAGCLLLAGRGGAQYRRGWVVGTGGARREVRQVVLSQN